MTDTKQWTTGCTIVDADFDVPSLLIEESKRGHSILHFSPGKSHLETTGDLLGKVSEVKPERLKSGRLIDGDWGSVQSAIEQLRDALIFFDDNSSCTTQSIADKARKLKQSACGLDLIVIDNLGLVTVDFGTGQTVENETFWVRQELGELAKELSVAIVIVDMSDAFKLHEKQPT